MSREELVAVRTESNDSQSEYMTKVISFAAKMTPTFMVAAKERGAPKAVVEKLHQRARDMGVAGEDIEDGFVVDGKFPALAAMAVALNVVRLLPVEMRGRLVQACIDFLLLNAEISQESMKAVLYNSLLEVGSNTGMVVIDLDAEKA